MVKCPILLGQEDGCGGVDGFDPLGMVTGDAHVLFITHRTGAWQQHLSGGCTEVERLGMMKDTSAHSAWEDGVALGNSLVSLSTAAQF